MTKPWLENGIPLVDAADRPIWCDSCPCDVVEPCIQCAGTTPSFFDVTLPELTPSPCCGYYDYRTYRLTRFSPCSWLFTFPPYNGQNPCGFSTLQLSLIANEIQVILTYLAGGGFTYNFYRFPPPRSGGLIICSQLVDFEMDTISTVPGAPCVWSTGWLSITAIP